MSYIPVGTNPLSIKVVKLSISTGAWAAEMTISLASSGTIASGDFTKFLDLSVFRS